MPSRVASGSARPPVETLPEMNACTSGREMLQLLFSALGLTHCCSRAVMCQVEVTDLTGICAHWVANGEGRGRGKRSTRAQGRPSVSVGLLPAGLPDACSALRRRYRLRPWPVTLQWPSSQSAWQGLFSRPRPSAFWWVGVSLPPSSGCVHCGSMYSRKNCPSSFVLDCEDQGWVPHWV